MDRVSKVSEGDHWSVVFQLSTIGEAENIDSAIAPVSNNPELATTLLFLPFYYSSCSYSLDA